MLEKNDGSSMAAVDAVTFSSSSLMLAASSRSRSSSSSSSPSRPLSHLSSSPLMLAASSSFTSSSGSSALCSTSYDSIVTVLRCDQQPTTTTTTTRRLSALSSREILKSANFVLIDKRVRRIQCSITANRPLRMATDWSYWFHFTHLPFVWFALWSYLTTTNSAWLLELFSCLTNLFVVLMLVVWFIRNSYSP